MRRTESDMISEVSKYEGRIFPGTNMTICGFAGRDNAGRILVECNSESRGNFIAVWSEVKRGNTKGTIRGESHGGKNKCEIDGDVLKVFLNSGDYFLCDAQDINLVQRYTWYLNKNGYARSSGGLYFHRLVLEASDKHIVDHINRNKLDNRRCNLRVCKSVDNSHNMNMFCTNSSGHTGVYKKHNGKYYAEIWANGKKIYLGTFEKYEEACAAYDNAKEKYHKFFWGVVSNYGLAGSA